MFNPPEELHTRFEAALAEKKAHLGEEYAMIIDGKEVKTDEKFENRSPIDTGMVLGIFQKGNAETANLAVGAAKKAFPAWSHTPWEKRVELLRKTAALMDERIYEFGVAMSLEVGKNRTEGLGDAAETADLIRYACDQVEAHKGFVYEMGHDPLVGFKADNTSVLRPYGVWLVISPFNFPCALTGGPVGAALAAGNTVVMKPATDTPWTARLLAECLRDAGLPAGVFNYVTGGGATLGQALIEHPDVAGVTFTGSYNVGMKLYRDFAAGKWVRPTILELGGKNPVIVTKHADLETAVTGIIRSAFGLQGQKCSAASRIYIEDAVYDTLVGKLVDATNKLTIGDPTDRKVWLGPVINKASYNDYQNFVDDLKHSGKILTGGKILTDGALSKGYYCAPTLVENLPYSHQLWKHEMFLPISTIGRVKNLDEALALANDVSYGLTSGIYGNDDEIATFFDKIEAGVNYANRPQGATTGAWPGFQPFGGWKGSGSSGKNAGGLYYVQLYMHEQIRTQIRKA
jgi:1-pyrroline-5-carboxylate dehydrogenase